VHAAIAHTERIIVEIVFIILISGFMDLWIYEKQQNSKYKKQINNNFQIQNFKQPSERSLFSSFSFFESCNLFVIYYLFFVIFPHYTT